MSSRLAEPKRRAGQPMVTPRGGRGGAQGPGVQRKGSIGKTDHGPKDKVIVQTRMPGPAGKREGYKAVVVKKEAMRSLFHVFKGADKAGKGNLNLDEFTTWVSSWHPDATERTITGLLSQLNNKQSDFTYRDMIRILYPGISKEEADSLEDLGWEETVSIKRGPTAEELAEAEALFGMLDADASGFLTKQEVKDGLVDDSIFGPEEMEDLFSQLTLKDGYMDKPQFVKWYLKNDDE